MIIRHPSARYLLLLLLVFSAAAQAQVSTDAAKAALLEVIKEYQPGMPVTEALTAKIDAATSALENSTEAPNLQADASGADGIWINMFSSQGILGDIDVSFMTRALPGGGQSGGKATALTVLQELHPEQRFYRNMMTMITGDVPFLYICLLYTSPSPRDLSTSRMPSSA